MTKIKKRRLDWAKDLLQADTFDCRRESRQILIASAQAEGWSEGLLISGHNVVSLAHNYLPNKVILDRASYRHLSIHRVPLLIDATTKDLKARDGGSLSDVCGHWPVRRGNRINGL